MTTEDESATGGTRHLNPLVDAMAQAAGNEPLILLQGFPTRTDREGLMRLYQDLTLSAYLEIHDADVLGLVETQSEREPVIVAVRPTARITGVTRGTFAAETTRDALARPPECRGEIAGVIPPYMPAVEAVSTAGQAMFWQRCQIDGPIWAWERVCYRDGPCLFLPKFLGYKFVCGL